MMNCIAISQNLIPKKTQLDNTPHYCFSIDQSKTIARLLEHGKYNDTIVNHLEELNILLEKGNRTCDSITDVQQSQIQRYTYMITNYEEVQQLWKEKTKKTKRKHKLQNIVLWAGLIGVTSLIFIKN